jgi:hypothetical protein
MKPVADKLIRCMQKIEIKRPDVIYMGSAYDGLLPERLALLQCW